jgi:uncharacterized protein (DUF924 family)
MTAHPMDIVGFWRSAGPKKWFAKDQGFDSMIALRFEQTHYRASQRRYDAWVETPEGALALMILLDQFPRNLYRGTAHAFATDRKARDVRRAPPSPPAMTRPSKPDAAVLLSALRALRIAGRPGTLRRAVRRAAGRQRRRRDLKFAIIHRDIIARFGRFPHRNAVLGRETTPEEQEFLDEGGFAG